MAIVAACARPPERGTAGAPAAALYVVDAESAYRFCPVQWADAWTQCFVWWDGQGRAAVVVDRRMGFGGAFAPNRFDRLSTLVAAWAQRKHAQFDATQPLPGAAERWVRAQQAAGMEGGAAQLAPRYLQVYIDDFTGVALADEVTPPPEVADIVIDPAHTRAAGGGAPVPCTGRAHVHAQLTVLALAELGLHAAPAK
eukprot:6175258-Pleurochrysis_carterae.AAC.1